MGRKFNISSSVAVHRVPQMTGEQLSCGSFRGSPVTGMKAPEFRGSSSVRPSTQAGLRQGDHARPLRHAAVLRLQLRRLPRSLTEHADPKGPHSPAQDLPRKLVQEEPGKRRLPVARVRRERARPGVDLQALRPGEGGGGGQEEHHRLAARGWRHRHQRSGQRCGYGGPVRRAQVFLAEGDEGVESLLLPTSWSRSTCSGGGGKFVN
uniref:uncharacterized protein LOC120812022 n=1 Tax=Gasterosteus aculeatus aculeatus TaxID=481459 RepID=UPI001A97E6B3|nr:uncharacterized protein LOC120812022 [Gasterosteus aculeatus aculeatus]